MISTIANCTKLWSALFNLNYLFIFLNNSFLLNDNQSIYLVCRYAFTITYNVLCWFTAITARKWEMHTMEKAVVLYIIHISIVLELKLRYLSASLQHLYRVVITKTWGSNVAQVMLWYHVYGGCLILHLPYIVHVGKILYAGLFCAPVRTITNVTILKQGK